jgi:hypothetical protein
MKHAATTCLVEFGMRINQRSTQAPPEQLLALGPSNETSTGDEGSVLTLNSSPVANQLAQAILRAAAWE